MWKFVATAALLLTSLASFADGSPRVQFGAFDALRIGMSEHQVARAAGSPLVHLAPEAEEEGCFYGSVLGLPEGVSLMFVNGKLVRFDVSEPGIYTLSGAEIGTTERSLKQLYGPKLRQQPHAYTGPEGHYFTLLSPDKSLGVRFETDGSTVTRYYSGTADAIEFIEGCQ